MEYLPPTIGCHIFMNNYLTFFRLLTHLGVNNIRATDVLNKIRLLKCAIIGDKQPQKKECGYSEKRTSSKKVIQIWQWLVWRDNRAVFIASSKTSEPKAFVWRLNKVERNYIQEQQPNSLKLYSRTTTKVFYVTTRTLIFPTECTRMLPSAGLVSEWKNGGGSHLLEWSILSFRMRGCYIMLIKTQAMSLCLF